MNHVMAASMIPSERQCEKMTEDDTSSYSDRLATEVNTSATNDMDSEKASPQRFYNPELDASEVPDDCLEVLPLDFEDYNVMSVEQKQLLERGGVLLSLVCTQAFSPNQAKMVNTLANLTSFDDEVRENSVPNYGPGEDSNPFILVKTVYLLPFSSLIDWITPGKLASTTYQRQCQVPSTIFSSNDSSPDTFRFTKPIIPLVFSMTVQFRVSELSRDTLDSLTDCIGGVYIHKGLLLERTKRHANPKPDRCLKAKSVLLYTQVRGGVLCHHLSAIMLSNIPALIATIMTRYRSLGSSETSETISRTRRYLRTVDMTTS